MNSTQIACFLAAARSESFSIAADSMYMTPPTFGRQISSLEQELGFLLFQRGWKNNQLTPAGQIMYEGFSNMTAEYHLLLSRAANAETSIAGTLTLGLLEGQLVDEELRSVLQAFEAHFPRVTLELRRYSFHDMLCALKCAELDAGITLTVELMDHPEFHSLPLYSVENELVMSAENPLAARANLTLADCADETFIEIEQSDSPIISGLMRDSCRRAGFAPHICTVSDLKAQISAVELGRGIAAFNRFHQTCNYPGLAHLPIPELPVVEFSLAWSKAAKNLALPYLVSQFQTQFDARR